MTWGGGFSEAAASPPARMMAARGAEDSDTDEDLLSGSDSSDALNPASPWISYLDDAGDAYFVNEVTQASSWEQPAEGVSRREGAPREDTEDGEFSSDDSGED